MERFERRRWGSLIIDFGEQLVTIAVVACCGESVEWGSFKTDTPSDALIPLCNATMRWSTRDPRDDAHRTRWKVISVKPTDDQSCKLSNSLVAITDGSALDWMTVF